LQITERDIFNFVFYPELVKEEIKAFLATIENNSDAIAFFKELKSELETSISKDIKKKIGDKIKSYLSINIIELHPLRAPAIKKANGSRLAAASTTELKPKMTTKTFVDNEKEYLIKVLNYGETTKVFVFSTKDEVVKNFDIIIEPHHLKYHLEDNSEPLKIEQSIEAEKIKLEFV
jgi:hypothetical protein